MSTPTHTIKQAAHQLIDQLPDEASWKDLIYELSVMQDIEEGLEDSDADRVVDNATVRQEFGLPECRLIGHKRAGIDYNSSMTI